MSEQAAVGGNTPYLQVEDLVKKFGEFVALRDISLAVHDGEFVCFLGPSGCGKTTLLRAIAGLDIQTSGRIEQAGRDISALPPAERDFGIVFQSYALFPNLTVRKNVAYGLHGRGLSREQVASRVRELLELVGLPEQGDKYPAQLSGGQQQRIALARAIATSPGLLLLDEPLSALDAKVRVRLRHEIKELQRQLSVTTIMVTHDQEEALTMADRIVVMNDGVVEQIGSPIEIYREPRTAFVADFIGTMNFMTCEFESPERVTIGGLALACEHEETVRSGPAVVAVRPEEIEIFRGDETDASMSNCLRGRIADMEFLGSFFRLRIHTSALQDQALLADFSTERVRAFDLKSGDDIVMHIAPEHLRVYPRQ